MELYVLDDSLRRVQVVDVFQSLIWTERFQDSGDFELQLTSDSPHRSLLTPGVKLACNTSLRMMVVETAENKSDDDGTITLTISGREITDILKDRIAKETMSNLTTDPDWTITDTPAGIIRTIFHNICVTGVLNVNDKIPYIHEGSFLGTVGTWQSLDPTLVWNSAVGVWNGAYSSTTPSTPADLADPITVKFAPDSVFKIIQSIAQAYGIGFRIQRNYDKSELWFEVYTGVDRTAQQAQVDAVIFSGDLDNVKGTTELQSISDSKNIASVFSANGVVTVYITGSEPVGFDRRMLYVDASDITDSAGPTLTAKLSQRGYEALSQYLNITAFDGEVIQISGYVYGVNYGLGDLVEVKNLDGVFNTSRVTEQIMVHDDQGERSYPTLVNEVVVNPGSWASLDPTLVWNTATGYWADQEV